MRSDSSALHFVLNNPHGKPDGINGVPSTPTWSARAGSKFFRENVFEANLQLVEHRFQFVQCQMMFAVFDSEKRLMGQPDPFCKSGVRQRPPLLSQELCQLAIKISAHSRRVANNS